MRSYTTTRFLVGFGTLYAVLAGLAELDPTGRHGVAILAAIVPVAVPVDRWNGGHGILATFGRPGAVPVLVAAALALSIQLTYPVVARVTGSRLALQDDWLLLLVGIFAFHGLAEELVWRGYAYRRLRERRTAGRAALATMPLIAATHLPVVVSSGLMVGIAAMLVAAVTSLPLAHLFDMGRRTIWAPAVLHTGIDTFKLLDIPADARLPVSLSLATVSLVLPLFALVARESTSTGSRTAP